MLKVDILAIYQTLEVKLPFVLLNMMLVVHLLQMAFVEEISFLENFYHEWKLKVVKHLEMTMSFLSFILFIWCVKLTDEHVTFHPQNKSHPIIVCNLLDGLWNSVC